MLCTSVNNPSSVFHVNSLDLSIMNHNDYLSELDECERRFDVPDRLFIELQLAASFTRCRYSSHRECMLGGGSFSIFSAMARR